MKLSDYVEKFKELITKCDISGSAALHMFTNGLTTEECKDCMMHSTKWQSILKTLKQGQLFLTRLLDLDQGANGTCRSTGCMLPRSMP